MHRFTRRCPAFVVPISVTLALIAPAVLPVRAAAQSPSPDVVAPSAAVPVTVTDAEGQEVVVADASRVVSLGGVVTEIVYALGAQDQLVAVDVSSVEPPEALETKPSVGYFRFLTAEPVLSANPTLILGPAEAGPAEVMEQVRAAGATILLLPSDATAEAAVARILAIGRALGRDAQAAALVAKLESDLAAARALAAEATSRPRVMFVLRPPFAPLAVSGTGTQADAMIALAGAENAVTGYERYVPISAEAAVAAAPDVILTVTRTLDDIGGIDALLAQPGLAQTPAGQARAVVAMDDLYLLGFGPRLGEAVRDLALQLHPELAQR